MIPRTPPVEPFFESFPSLPRAAENFHLNATTLQTAGNIIQWAHNAKMSEAGLQSAYLVATVVNDFAPLPGGAKFDFAKAITCWDKHHWTAFRTWICEYLVANPNVRVEPDPDERPLEFNS
jgi:hypothetical protein